MSATTDLRDLTELLVACGNRYGGVFRNIASEIDHLRALLAKARAEINETLIDSGGCDHSVGICCCSTQRLLDEIDAALEGREK